MKWRQAHAEIVIIEARRSRRSARGLISHGRGMRVAHRHLREWRFALLAALHLTKPVAKYRRIGVVCHKYIRHRARRPLGRCAPNSRALEHILNKAGCIVRDQLARAHRRLIHAQHSGRRS